MLRRKFLSLLGLTALVPMCKPMPGPDGGPSVTPGSVISIITTIMDVLNVILPIFRTFMVRLIPDGPAKVGVLTATDVVVATATDWARVANVYTSRGGDACQLYAGTGSLTEALMALAERLTLAGFGWGNEIGQLISDLGLLADRLIGRCSLDAGDLSDAQILVGASSSTSISTQLSNRLSDLLTAARARGGLRTLPPIRPESIPR